MMERQCEGEDVFFEHFGECCEGIRSYFSQKVPFLSEIHHFWSEIDSNQVFKLDFQYGTIRDGPKTQEMKLESE